MNGKQWLTLQVLFLGLGMLFIFLTSTWRDFCDFEVLEMSNIYACIRAESFAPFVYIFFGLVFIIPILSFLRTDKKH